MSEMTYAEQMQIIKNHQSTPPVKVTPIAEDLGINVFSVPNWDNSISGMIKKNEDDPTRYSIYVNGKHSRQRRRFTIAHEIAHFIMHKTLIGDGIADDGHYRSSLSNQVEAQANALGGSILMPWHLLKPLISNITGTNELARVFDVSPDIMAIRIAGIPSGDTSIDTVSGVSSMATTPFGKDDIERLIKLNIDKLEREIQEILK